MRELSKNFLFDLQSPNGLLRPVFERVRQDHTLMLAIRDGYINIYYRGGNLIKVQEQSKGSYSSFFDKNYNKMSCSIVDMNGHIVYSEQFVTGAGENVRLKIPSVTSGVYLLEILIDSTLYCEKILIRN